MKMNKHFLAITKKVKASRPILQGVSFDKNSNKINCTDSHRLLSIDYNGVIDRDVVLNLETLEEIEGSYPNIERLIPTANEDILTIDSLDITPDVIKLIKVYKKQMICFTFNEDEILLSARDIHNHTDKKDIITIKCKDEYNYGKYEKIYFNGQYIVDLFNLINEYGKERYKNKKSSNVTIIHKGCNRPMLFSMDGIRYLVVPIRVL